MKNFFQYLPASEMDRKWGLYLTVAGCQKSPPGVVYPSKEHPTGYYFDWQVGRVLDEYQLIYITKGSGTLEISKSKYRIRSGTLMLICPGIRHRYRPDADTGWEESYIGFKGSIGEHFLEQALQGSIQPIIECGNRVEILDTYQKIFDIVSTQKPAFQQIASGIIIKLLGYLLSFKKQSSIEGESIEEMVGSARVYMWENINKESDIHGFARSLNVSYSYFRKIFKLYTGISPHQYYLDLKIMRAKELILSTEKSIKEITHELDFDSIHYFSRLFKKKTGVSPSEYRKNS